MTEEHHKPIAISMSAHGWGDDEDDLTIDQTIENLNQGDYRSLAFNLTPQFALDHHGLIAAYLKTVFWLKETDTAIRIGKYSLAAHRITAAIEKSRASRRGMALISAANPFGATLSWEDNRQRQQTLKTEMRESGLLLDEGMGISSEPDESGQLFWEPLCAVGPVTHEEAKELSLHYQQIAVVFTGTLEPAKLVFSGITPRQL